MAPLVPPAVPAFRDLVRALRPSQWTKNLVVPAAFFFAYWDRSRAVPLGPSDLAAVIPAVLIFCVLSSGVYVLNDLTDIESDRHHPVKRHRPIAAGRIRTGQAGLLGLLLLAAGGVAAWRLSRPFAAVTAGYVAVQMVYTFWLKQIALVDIMVIASGFVLRAIAGAVVLPGVTISPWLLLCTFLLALFLALCKRRHEKALAPDHDPRHRPSLVKYDRYLLDQLIAVTAGATIVCYAIYTLWPETVAKFGTTGLGCTIPFVVFGLFRYMDLVFRHDKGGRPEKILLTDLPLLATLGLYGLTTLVVFLLHS